ncbi:malto-oligosyltrehalose trehalohydrolase [Devosia rhizoryzae]|uniref:Malto-oligosyltrehalose trehalohydrolase n=1 Tax=Devosia rhizoryzae TaxID=2774137 RepID=A0ABX7C394_9HYPH|nr:malto-oligosyltrehalose trehalohydrolase [Devosia rhizoryzae]QQR38704.1 malto-oligosyltrehalose trehalohydrolase [Devosia rhizoryzae]
MKFGTQMLAEGVRFRLWAPYSKFVALKIYELDLVVPMQKLARGWYEVEVDAARAGMRYRFVLDDGSEVPDPATRFQPEDVDGPSEVIDPLAFGWTDIGWRGHEWEELVLYELHIGTFTQEGTFRAAMDRLDHLVELGVTAIEIMPIADFPGRWNWGYDGAQLFAPDSSYGRPEDLKALVDLAHTKGLSVFLDVVYNHFGPKGNYLAVYTPLTTDHYETPWGAAVNFDAAGSAIVREFFFANARYWLNEFHLDGLRLDAVHEIRDAGFRHMLQELAEQIRAATDGRHVHLVVENEKNEAGWLKRRDDGAPWLYNGQWSDDIHHGLHVALTGESQWYYADYVGRTDLIGRSLAEGLAWQGEYMEHVGRHRGEPSTFLPASAFIAFMQNHDQIGNRPFGERPTVLTSPAAIRLWAAINLLSPQVPMLFMGEEWGTKQPFLFFSDVGEDLADPIREGRLKELAKFPHREGDVPPDPMAEATFDACKLDWNWGDNEDSKRQHWLYRRLLSVRRKEIVPRLAGMTGESGHYQVLAEKVVKVWWTLGDGSELSMVANLGTEPFQGVGVWGEDHLWLEGSATGDTLDGLSVVFSLRPSAA